MTHSDAYRSPLLNRPGATPAADDDPALAGLETSGVAWHYGDPLGEQRAAASGPVWIDRSHRGVLKVSGPDAAEFLNNLLSQKLDDSSDGFTASALDLDSQGHVLHHAEVSVKNGAFFLDLPAEQAESLAEFLRRMVFWSQVTVEEVDLGVVTVLDGSRPRPGGALDAAPGPATVARAVDWDGPARTDLLVERGLLDAAVDALEAAGARPAGLMAWTAARVRALEPELAADLDQRAIPHEVPHWIGRHGRAGAVHLHKGCYRGQETVSRVENVGRSPRLLVLLQLDGSAPELPVPGTQLTAGGRRVGRVGSVVHHFEDGPVALGLVKRSALDLTGLTAGSTAVAVDPTSLPADEGEKAGRAAIDNLRSARRAAGNDPRQRG